MMSLKLILLSVLVIIVLLLRGLDDDEVDVEALHRRKRRRVYAAVQSKKRMIATACIISMLNLQRLPGVGRGHGRRRCKGRLGFILLFTLPIHLSKTYHDVAVPIAVWKISRLNDRYADFMNIYAALGRQWPDLENSEYLALFRMGKEVFEMLYCTGLEDLPTWARGCTSDLRTHTLRWQISNHLYSRTATIYKVNTTVHHIDIPSAL